MIHCHNYYFEVVIPLHSDLNYFWWWVSWWCYWAFLPPHNSFFFRCFPIFYLLAFFIDIVFLGSKITADGDCSPKIKRRLLLGSKAMTNLGRVLKSRDILLPTKVCLVKAMVFPLVMYGCASWTRKKAECQEIDAFELWCWRRLLRGPWTARRSNQSILKEINPEYSLEGLMVKLQYFSHLMWRSDY